MEPRGGDGDPTLPVPPLDRTAPGGPGDPTVVSSPPVGSDGLPATPDPTLVGPPSPPGAVWVNPADTSAQGFAPPSPPPTPAAGWAAPAPSAHRPVAATLVLAGAGLFAWFVAGAVANLGTDVLKPAVFVELAGVRVFAPAALVGLGLALWLRRARGRAAGLLTAAFGLALVAYALSQSYREWRYLIGSVEFAGAVLVTLGGLGGLRRRPG